MTCYLLKTAVIASGSWLTALILLSCPSVQRHVFYLHKFPIWWGQKLDHPETFGFLSNQVSALTIPTADGERLYAWLVLPLRVYGKHEDHLARVLSRAESSQAVLQIMRGDPDRRLVVYFHGNASTVGSTRRTEAYRSILAGSLKYIYVLSFDYRGFGRSTGSPTENGLKEDAIAVIEWAHINLHMPYERMLLLAQFLGTAVACTALDHYATRQSLSPFAGTILCAPFTDMKDAFMSFKVAKAVPLLAPLRGLPFFRRWFSRRLVDKWHTADHLESTLRKFDDLHLTFVHCTVDDVVPYRMTQVLASHALATLKEFGKVEESSTS